MVHDAAGEVFGAVRRAAEAGGAPWVLAVSGGLDSTALLVATAQVARDRVGIVATVDHGTGRAASAAAAQVARMATALGFPVVVCRAAATGGEQGGREAAWRRQRHAALAAVALPLGGRVVTAHTRDDQVETVLMRELRGAGARGLAGLLAPSPILRPLVDVPRSALVAFLRHAGVAWMEDPSNASRAFLRNRVRHDLLPALRQVAPAIDDELLAVGRAAAHWRRAMDAHAGAIVTAAPVGAHSLSVASGELRGYSRDSLAMLWGSLAGRVGLALDRRGTERLVSFIMKESSTGCIPLSGGWRLEARRDRYELHRDDGSLAAPATLPRSGMAEWGRFRFQVRTAMPAGRRDPWQATLPAELGVEVRAWRAGDRLATAGGQGPRRVARYLSDAGLHGSDRRGWPVLVAGPTREVVWIPGVRRSDAATERSGGPVRHYLCERIAP
jgi:tRNA(Ile)-lysidine synthase